MGSRARIVVLGTAASMPYAGMAWMQMQYVLGLRRLGHEAYYFEITSNWPFDPELGAKTCESQYALKYLAEIASEFGIDHAWAYRRSYLDDSWFGIDRRRAENILATADLVLNVAGSTLFSKERLQTGRRVYLGTDPVFHELLFKTADPFVTKLVGEHDDVATYGECIGRDTCTIPPLPGMRATTRQPVVLDLWRDAGKPGCAFTTVANWRQDGRDVTFDGETYFWSKDREFKKFLDVPERVTEQFELASNLENPANIRHHPFGNEPVKGMGMDGRDRAELLDHGWRLVDSRSFTSHPGPYHEYICRSRGEFTVARDLNVRLRSGWFSERSACYLAAGRPVVTQDTGFSDIIPTGEGLFAFTTMEDILTAFDAIRSDYARHGKAAAELAGEYFDSGKVLTQLLEDLG